jgi:hypothetical protein
MAPTWKWASVRVAMNLCSWLENSFMRLSGQLLFPSRLGTYKLCGRGKKNQSLDIRRASGCEDGNNEIGGGALTCVQKG